MRIIVTGSSSGVGKATASALAAAGHSVVLTELPSGTYIAPCFKQVGTPRATRSLKKARDPVVGHRLWVLSAELTGCDWNSA